MSGFIKISRQFFDHWLWSTDEPLCPRAAWLDLIQSAAFKPYKVAVRGKLVSLDLGELVASERYLSERWQWKRSKVRAFLKMLEADCMISRRADQSETIISLCNYCDYNGPPTAERPVFAQSPPSGHPVSAQSPPKVEEGEEVEECKEHTERAGVCRLEDVKKLAGSRPEWAAYLPDIAEEYLDSRRACGWVDGRGNPIQDWRSDFRRFARSYAENRRYGHKPHRNGASGRPNRNTGTANGAGARATAPRPPGV